MRLVLCVLVGRGVRTHRAHTAGYLGVVCVRAHITACCKLFSNICSKTARCEKRTKSLERAG